MKGWARIKSLLMAPQIKRYNVSVTRIREFMRVRNSSMRLVLPNCHWLAPDLLC
jgi:hypothetical protein